MGAEQRIRRALTIAGVAILLAAPDIVRAKVSFIPIPEIVTSPTEGPTFGLLGVFLFLDEKDEIRYMMAPDATYNETKGFMATFRLFGYPTPTRRYSVVIGKSTTADEDYELEWSDRGFWDGRAFVLASFIHERDSTERFFGFGNNSPERECKPGEQFDPDDEDPCGESNYTNNDTVAQATPGVWLLPFVNLNYRMRIRRYGVDDGQVDKLAFTEDAHREDLNPCIKERPNGSCAARLDKGLDTGVIWGHQTALVYDTRDDTDIPRKGALALIYGEFADRRLGSTTSFVKFGGETRKFIPLLDGNPVLALRALLEYTSGAGDTPFWERSSLGGRRTLRGYGSDRFIDFNRSLASVEVRTRVYQRHIFGVNAELELAPFVETGQVFSDVSDSPVSDLHWVGGIGFRGVVRPQIVGFVDIGYGAEGSAIFTGVNYPF
jgi:outer membrane protein assembly factor BamA